MSTSNSEVLYNYHGKKISVPSMEARALRDFLTRAIISGDYVCLSGPTGCGKSTIIRSHLPPSVPFVRVDCSTNIDEDHIVGHERIRGSETVWVDGVLTDAIRNGKWIVMEEINGIRPGVKLALQSLLERGSRYFKILTTGEEVRIHRDFRLFATKNPVGMTYAGTTRENMASNDRWVILSVDYMTAQDETTYLMGHFGYYQGMDGYNELKTVVSGLCAAAAILRRDHVNGELEFPFTTRKIMQIIEYSHDMPITEAYRHLLTGFCDGDVSAVGKVRDAMDTSLSNKESVNNVFITYGRALIKNNSNDGTPGSGDTKATLNKVVDKLKTAIREKRIDTCLQTYTESDPFDVIAKMGPKTDYLSLAYSYPPEAMVTSNRVSPYDWEQFVKACDVLERNRVVPKYRQ